MKSENDSEKEAKNALPQSRLTSLARPSKARFVTRVSEAVADKAYLEAPSADPVPQASFSGSLPVEAEGTGPMVSATLRRRSLKAVLIVTLLFFIVLAVASGLTLLLIRPAERSVPAGEGMASARFASASVPSAAAMEEINDALAEMRTGKTESALFRLERVESDGARIPSVDYLAALAALEAGDFEKADEKALSSIRKGERVSDALAIRAVLQSINPADLTRKPFGDPRIRAEELLKEAMVSDVASARPLIGLARLFRSQGRNEESLELLQGALDRLRPADNSIAISISIELLKLQGLPDEELPSSVPSSHDFSDIVGAAYVAMRRGEFAQSALLLRISQEQLPWDIFDYVLHDPAIRRYSNEPRLAEFFGNP